MKILWGLLEYKPTWTLTLEGWIALLSILTLVTLLLLTKIQEFLAYSHPLEADVLVVEGWVSDQAIKGAMAEFRQGNYKMLITTGIPIPRGYHLAKYKNFADLGAANLIALGFPPDKVIAVPGNDTDIYRTTASAEAFRDWLSTSDLGIKAINIYSLDVHTRRSWLIYKTILRDQVKVGAIAHPPVYYDPKRWWTSSHGVRTVIAEAIAYTYAKLTNHP